MDYIKVLGSSGSKSKNLGTSSFLISNDIVIDAGNILNTLEEESNKINHIFLTHTHLDHIIDIPFIIDNCFSTREDSLKVYGSIQTISFLKEHVFNNIIWPDFTKIKLPNKDIYSLVFIEIDDKVETVFGNLSIKAINTKHTDGSFAYLISKNEIKYLISGDTDFDQDFISCINSIDDLSALFIECSFPNVLEEVAKSSKHLTANSLKEFLNNLTKNDLTIFLYHLKTPYQDKIKDEIKKLNILKNGGRILNDGDTIYLKDFQVSSAMQDIDIFDRVMDINLRLSSEQDKEHLYEMILTLLRELTLSDAGTLYLLSEDKKYLEFKVIQNDSLNIFLGTKEEKISWDALPLYLPNKEENRAMIAVVCALDKKIINIKDLYNCDLYNFEGTKFFDISKNYKSKSMLVVPLVNHEDDIIGVIQLINKDITNKNSFYNSYDEKVIKALSLQAAMALTNTILIDSLENFLDSFVNSIANAIDAKSRHTSTHITKMSKLAPLIAKSISDDDTIYKDIEYSKNDLKEIELAAKLHDIGKISIPEWVIDKSTKLQKLLDGFELIKLRFEVIKRDLKIDFLENKISKEEYETTLKIIEEDLEFIDKSNKGGEFMSDECLKRIKNLSSYSYILSNKEEKLLNEDEIYNLSIRKGTLTNEERDIMNSHAKLSFDMLSALPFPKKYSNIMHISVNHHEKLNGKGYPRGLSGKDLVLEDRILILADIFEALSSNDRPYKGVKKLSEIFKILDFMVNDGEIDRDLLEFFKKSDAFKEYCKTELLQEQLDV
ncbi:phosphohydrolase [Aliarcobacter trophiarum LMG 25534]|uniref:C-di-GMP phosphodiesterase, class II (HD-GYP, GAF domains) n=1 Tax=Aliarcobacter trophiarum LMG 25534 TaxID=1032241 RepID=A0AAD0QJA9_9BACT|nr:HD domain-containing phosphohydrolase [Aliarcobacter trophiarum]AXK48779.1 c-di-GMP phosphodiesterase, class II (HD-GYP, GAF domains) [Aliarcobacter trophiarum LMG 25534]RXI25040.1 phosphohydrolase [Aliarcobacter trophiarum]RXJ92101.1 phosphohydrolase [Aliarcobacter trophiarum LMG 25534]